MDKVYFGNLLGQLEKAQYEVGNQFQYTLMDESLKQRVLEVLKYWAPDFHFELKTNINTGTVSVTPFLYLDRHCKEKIRVHIEFDLKDKK